MRALVLAATLFAAAPAVAQTAAPTSLTLADAAKACTASGGSEPPATRACRRIVQRLGPVTAFSWKGVALTAEQIAVCNA